MKYVQVPTQHPFTDYREEEFGTKFQMFMNCQHPGHHSRWIICVSVFASKCLAQCHTRAILLLKLSVYAIFLALLQTMMLTSNSSFKES